MRLLVTGAFGYLGSRLADLLPHDLVLTGREQPAWAATHARKGEFRRLDVLDGTSIAEAMRDVDAVLHLASLDENEAARDPDLAIRVSGEGTRRLLVAARAAGVSRFIFLSTYHVYAPSPGPAIIDEHSLIRPSHPYGISRLVGEGYCYENNRLGAATRAIVLRLSNGYGAPGSIHVDRWSLAHNDFCRQAFQSGKIVLKTTGAQHRDMISIDDVAQGIARVLASESLPHDVFNLGGAQSVRILDLAELVRSCAEEYLGRSIALERPQAQSVETAAPVRYAIDRLRALGFEPKDRLRPETLRLLELLRTESARL